MAAGQVTPPPPPGFVLQDNLPPPPPGFVVQGAAQLPGVPSNMGGGNVVGRVARGLRQGIDAGAQLVANSVPESVNDAVDYYPAQWRASSNPIVSGLANALLADPHAGPVNKRLQQEEAKYQQERAAAGSTGVDVGRTIGNFISPTSIALAKSVPIAAGGSIPGLAASGAKVGGLAGLLTPDYSGGKDFWMTKTGQGALGAATGAVITPALDRVVGAIVPRVAGLVQRLRNPEVVGAEASLKTDQAISQALREMNIDEQSVPQAYMAEIRSRVLDSLKQGREIDPAALLRQKDFQALNMLSLKGQITRDPARFAFERNMRADDEVGLPMLQRLNAQNQRLQELVAGLGGPQAQEAQVAGAQFAKGLREYDTGLRQGVSKAYADVKANTNIEAEIDPRGLSSDLGRIAQDYGKGNRAVQWAKGYFKEWGLFGDKPTKVFTAQDAEQAMQALNKAKSGDPAMAAAAGEIRNAIKKAVTDSGSDVYAPARELAKQRFSLQAAVPALEKAAAGELEPDKFVSQYIINADTKDVAALTKVLTPQQLKEARNQVGAYLQRAAFGENLTGDRLLRPEMFSKAIRTLGSEKLKLFYSPEELQQLQTTARVGAYINQAPSAAPVMGNPNMTWAGRVMRSLPGVPSSVRLAGALANYVKRGSEVEQSLNAQVPAPLVNPSPDMARRLALARQLSVQQGSSRAAKEAR